MKISFFGPQYGMGGAGHVCSDVGKALGRDGYRVDFLVDGSYSEDSYLEEDLPHSCSIIRLTDASPQNQSLLYLGSLFWSLLGYLRDQDRVILLSNLTKYNLLSVWASLLSGTTTNLFLVEHSLLSVRIGGIRSVLPALVRTHYTAGDGFIGVSTEITNEFISEYGLHEWMCTTIPNPVNVGRVAEMAKEAVDHRWFPEETPVIVGVGRFIAAKQFSVLIRGFETLRQRLDAKLILIGDGPRKDELIKQARSSNSGDHIDFLGFAKNPYKYMKRADLLAQSSKSEGFPVVLLEALACGTPVVATKSSRGASEIIGEGEYGRLVDVGDHAQLADAMEATLKNPSHSEKLTRRATKYDVGKVALRYADFIQNEACE